MTEPLVFTHVSTDRPIEALTNRRGYGGKATLVGKPAGFWMAPGLSWVALIAARDSWEIAGEIVPTVRPGERFRHTLAFYKDVFETERVPDFTAGTSLNPLGASALDHTHFVYQVELPSDVVSETPDRTKLFRLTAGGLDDFLALVDPWYDSTLAGTTAQYPRTKPFGPRLADYYELVMAPVWGGILFDASLFTPELTAAHRWIHDLEIPTMCLWNPVDVLALPATETNFQTSLKAVLTLVGDAQSLAKTILTGRQFTGRTPPLKPYLPMLFVAGVTTDDRLVMIMRKGKIAPGAKRDGKIVLSGGRRGRTFRRKPKRKNKNGSRSTRKSKHGRNQ